MNSMTELFLLWMGLDLIVLIGTILGGYVYGME